MSVAGVQILHKRVLMLFCIRNEKESDNGHSRGAQEKMWQRKGL